jgi:hypothetical protein
MLRAHPGLQAQVRGGGAALLRAVADAEQAGAQRPGHSKARSLAEPCTTAARAGVVAVHARQQRTPGVSHASGRHPTALEACTHIDCADFVSPACLQISGEELGEALQAAVVCTILAKAGPQRSRVLANLYKDERTHGLTLFPFMEKVYLERILRSEEVREIPSP